MDDNDDEFDMDFDMSGILAAVEQAEHRATAHNNLNNVTAATTSITTNTNHLDDLADIDFDDDFGDNVDDDDLDVDALLQAVDTVEQQHQQQQQARPSTSSGRSVQASLTSHFTPSSSRPPPATALHDPSPSRLGGSNARITFGMPEDMADPTPPPPPPADARTYHPLDRPNLPTWIYPTNHPIRGYQFNIVRKALFNNTLVAIPTGLGKTFIAAVVMYNYYRWFPDSILIFMAPTRPLVEQQIKACYDICGLPQKDTVMMVGTSIAKAKRPQLWSSGRVFFCTPQLVDNDLTNGYCPAHKVAMVVIDEAHKATGNYAYTNVIEKLGRIQSHFRILALSATPGSTVEKVQTVVNNLRINAIEVRTEESMDVQEFSFGKRVQTVVTKLNYTEGATGVVPKTAATFCRVLFQPVLDRLHKYHAIYNPSPERCSPFLLMSDRKTYAVNAKNVPAALKRKVTVDFLLAEALSRAYEGLCVYGVGTFVDTMERFLQGMRTTLEQNKAVPFEHQKVLSHVGLRQLLDSLVQQMAAPSFVGHPKMDALLSIILRHLNEQGSASTRIMVFASIRASVNMLVQFLAQHHPMIKCAPFVGQAGDTDGMKGMTQKEQQETIQRFKRGDINVMVATSIGEEGLDIGEVDLIICYDSQSSSIRLLQRMGRTGRRRQGHCVMLMTEQEERKFKKATDSYKYIQNMIASRNVIECSQDNPALLPRGYQPVVQRKQLAISTYINTLVQGRKRGRQDGKTVGKDGTLTAHGQASFLDSFPAYSTLDEAYRRFWPLTTMNSSLTKNLPLQQKLTPTKRVGHSRRTQHFVALVKTMEQKICQRDGGGDMGNDEVQVLKLPTRRKPRCAAEPSRAAPEDEWSTFIQPLITKGVDDDDDGGGAEAVLDFDAAQQDASNDGNSFLDFVFDSPMQQHIASPQQQDIANNKPVPDDDGNSFLDFAFDSPQQQQKDGKGDSPLQDVSNNAPVPNDSGNSFLDFAFDSPQQQQKAVPENSDLPLLQDEHGNSFLDFSSPVQQTAQQESVVDPTNENDDDDDDEFGSMDLDFLEQVAMGAPDRTTAVFLFDDDLDAPPRKPTTPSTFTTTFAWATTKPIYSNRAKQLLIQRLQHNVHLSVRLMNSDTHMDSQDWTIKNDQVGSPIEINSSQVEQDNSTVRSVVMNDDQDSMGSWEINDTDDKPSAPALLHSTPLRACEKDAFGIKAPYTLSPINRTSATPMRLFTPPRPFNVEKSPQPQSSDTSEISPIIRRRRRQILVSDDDDDNDVPPTKPVKTSTKRKQRPWMADNPFLDTEAVRSDDDVSTDDNDDNDDNDDSRMDSFIHDGSSGLAPEGTTTPDAMAMYRTSLHQTEYRRKTWLDKMSTDKWEMAADDEVLEDDDDDDEGDSRSMMEEENISSFTNASDDFI